MTGSPPTRRPIEADPDDVPSSDQAADLLTLPWIDPHNHAHTLSWADRERYALAGCRSMVMVAAGHHWIPYRPVRAEDVRFLWDDALNRRSAIEREHFFEARLALGVHTGARVADPDALIDAMAGYCERPAVGAVGETGVVPAQRGEPWPVEDQRRVVRAQMALAADQDLPVLLHTPNAADGSERTYRPGTGTPGYEAPGATGEAVLDGETPALDAVRIDVEAMRDTDLPEDRVVFSHADPTNTPYLMAETEAYLSYTVGHSWLTGVTAADVAATIEEYGPGRVMIDTDCANVLRTDPFAIKRAILELYRLGVDVPAIRQVVLENPRSVFGHPGDDG